MLWRAVEYAGSVCVCAYDIISEVSKNALSDSPSIDITNLEMTEETEPSGVI